MRIKNILFVSLKSRVSFSAQIWDVSTKFLRKTIINTPPPLLTFKLFDFYKTNLANLKLSVNIQIKFLRDLQIIKKLIVLFNCADSAGLTTNNALNIHQTPPKR